MTKCCGNNVKFDGISEDYKRRLWLVIMLNAAMFIIEITAGQVANSQALQADALDFLGDALTYGISLGLFLMGMWVLGSTIHRVFYIDVPEAEIMGVIGFLALMTNLASVLILVRYKDGDANVRSVWLCSRNDAIGNVAVMIAALSVWGTASRWPDLIVAAIMSGLFLSSAVQIVRQALKERREVNNVSC